MITSLPYHPVQKLTTRALVNTKTKIHGGKIHAKKNNIVQAFSVDKEATKIVEDKDLQEAARKFSDCYKKMKEQCWSSKEFGLTIEVSQIQVNFQTIIV